LKKVGKWYFDFYISLIDFKWIKVYFKLNFFSFFVFFLKKNYELSI
jgi:hypothetical protein